MTKRHPRKYKICTQIQLPIWEHATIKKVKALSKPKTKKGDSSPYGVRLREKQKMKFYYGNINEKQFHKTFTKATSLIGPSGDNFVSLLERRLDSSLYRSNFSPTVFLARQLISHGHILVNDKKVKSSSYLLKEGDLVQISVKSSSFLTQSLLNQIRMSSVYVKPVPSYLEVDFKCLSFILLYPPMPDEVPYYKQFDIKSVMEFYS